MLVHDGHVLISVTQTLLEYVLPAQNTLGFVVMVIVLPK